MKQFKGSIALQEIFTSYAQADGTYKFPNNREGVILRRCKNELEQFVKHFLKQPDKSDYAKCLACTEVCHKCLDEY